MKTPAQNRAAVKTHYQRRQEFLRSYKADKGCFDCGESDPIVLDLHHEDADSKHPALKGNARRIVTMRLSDLLTEIEKCVVLCANCHRREEHRRLHS